MHVTSGCNAASLAKLTSSLADTCPKSVRFSDGDLRRARTSCAFKQHAANLLGLSDQVPARVEFLTDGTSRTVKAGPMLIVLKRTTPRQMTAAGRTSGLVIQALRNLGADHLSAQQLNKLRRTIPAGQRRALLDDLALAPGWMHKALRVLATG